MGLLNYLLAHPLTRGLDIDDPMVTLLRKKIIQSKPFLKNIYKEWYEKLLSNVDHHKPILELGSGGGFIEEYSNEIITSEIIFVPGVNLIANACQLPFSKDALGAIILTNVFHHIPNVRQFLSEASRCVMDGGKIVMIEPWVNPWANWVYQNLHAEPFDTQGPWELAQKGPLSSANGALPWIVFTRDRLIFEQQFPQLKIQSVRPIMPFSYLLSGGVSLRNLMPGWSYTLCRSIEQYVKEKNLAMFAIIVLEKNSITAESSHLK